VILAGGGGERLGGVCKGELRIGGVRLVERVSAALGAVARPLLLSSGPETARRLALADALAVPDLPTSQGGPLMGLAAAVAALRQRGIDDGLLVSVTVDTPFLPADFVTVMQAALGAAPAAYASWGASFYPPNAIWRLEALAALPEQVLQERAPASLKALHRALGAKPVDWKPAHAADPFANLNTLADLLALGRRARR
jgi:molybdopterin-guanine dinucleotide biosynthesis protein A